MYYVVRIKYLKDGTEKRSEVMPYETRQQAIAKFHTNMGLDMVDETLTGSMCVVLNQHGGTEIKDYWEEEAPEIEPKEEPSEPEGTDLI